MQELIKISEQNGTRAVSARELYHLLEVKADFTTWIKRMFRYGFDENIDFSLTKIGERSVHNKTDYILTIDTAKEISMLQRNVRGKQVRRYFIEVEKIAVAIPNNYSNLVPAQKSQIQVKKEELIDMIKFYLRRGDIAKISANIGCRYDHVYKVLNTGEISRKILNALYDQAILNKNELLFGYQEMIDQLKS